MMQGFCLTLHVDRLCMHPLTTLDGSLGGMLSQGGAPDLSMIATETGVPLASYPLFESVWSGTDSVLRSFDRHLLHRVPDAIEGVKTQMVSVTGSKSSSYHRGSSHRVYTPSVNGIRYYFTGDAKHVAGTLKRIGAIGAWTGKGYGALKQDHKGEVAYLREVTTPLCGILDEDGKLVRPIPLAMAKKLGIDPAQYSVQYNRFTVPYGLHDVRRLGLPLDEVAMPVMAFEHD